MKKVFASLLAAAMAASVFSGCQPSTPGGASSEGPSNAGSASSTEASAEPAGDGQTLTIWCWDAALNVAAIKLASENYQKDNPDVNFNIMEIASSDVRTKLTTALASGAMDSLPNITLMEDYAAYTYLSKYHTVFADLTDIMPYDDFAPYKVAACSYDGKTYGVPFDSGVAAFFYRSDVFEECGIKEEDLQDLTLDQLLEYGKQIKEQTGKNLISFDITWVGDIIQPYMQGSGRYLIDENGEPDIIDNPALKETLEFLKATMDNDIASVVDVWGDMPARLNDGSTVAAINAAWYLSSLKAAEDQKGLWRMAPAPRITSVEGAVHASNNGGSSWYVFDNMDGTEESINFLKASLVDNSDEFYSSILVNQGVIGTYLPAQQIDAYDEGDEYFGGQKIYSAFREWIPEIPAVNYGEYTAQTRDVISAVAPEYLNGSLSIEDALAQIDSPIRAQMQ